MAENTTDGYRDIPVYKGLQRPLEIFGLQGRYVWWGAGSLFGSVIGFLIGSIVFGFVVALVVFTVIAGTGTVSILVKQRYGLHSKHIDKGIFVLYHYVLRGERY